MTISAVGALGATTSGTTASAAASTGDLSSSLNLDFSEYLQILTTQLQNQDPTDATDPNQFTQELVQMAGVQQQITTNTDLQALTAATSANSLAIGADYIGAYVQANDSSDELSLQSSSAMIGYQLPEAASSTSINIENSAGAVVATISGGTASGGNYVAWNGAENDGSTAPDGTYTFAVNAVDANGNPITVSNPVALFKVTSVQSNGDGTLQLLAGSLSLSSADVTNVYSAYTLPTYTTGTIAGSSSSSSTSS